MVLKPHWQIVRRVLINQFLLIFGVLLLLALSFFYFNFLSGKNWSAGYARPWLFSLFLFVGAILPAPITLIARYRQIRSDTLTIDEYGIRYSCRLRPLLSWHIAWTDIHSPVYQQRPLLRGLVFGRLFIPLQRTDGSKPSFWQRFLALSSSSFQQRVLRIDFIETWRNQDASASSGDISLAEMIERRLGPGSHNTVLSLPAFMENDARITVQRMARISLPLPEWSTHRLGRHAIWMFAGCLLFFVCGVGLSISRILLVDYTLLLWVLLGTALALPAVFLLRLGKETWPVCVFVGILWGATLSWLLFSVTLVQTVRGGECSIVTFKLASPDPAKSNRFGRPPRLDWYGLESNHARLHLRVHEETMIGSHRPGDLIDLPICNWMGIYTLDLDEPKDVFINNGAPLP